MPAAKEKMVRFLVVLIYLKMVNELLRKLAATQNKNHVYDEIETRKFKKTPIGSSEKIDRIVPVENGRRPRKNIRSNRLGSLKTQWALGSMYVRARYYDPKTEEFISQDPLEYVDGMSLYRGYFVVNAIDASGMACEEVSGCCIQNADIEISGPLRGGYKMSQYITQDAVAGHGPYWGNDEILGGFHTKDWGSLHGSEGASALGWKVQLLAEYKGNKSCGVTQVYNGSFESQKGKWTTDINQSETHLIGKNSRLLYFKEGRRKYMSFGDPPALFYHFPLKNDPSRYYYAEFETCFHSSGKNCTNSKCCVEWTVLFVDNRKYKTRNKFTKKLTVVRKKCYGDQTAPPGAIPTIEFQ